MSPARAASTDSKGRRKGDEDRRKPPGHWIRENVEAIVVAFVLALIIRHFSVEAFKIPTGSMQPTLYGDERGGDRILVFKPSYVNSGPERWDIIVFRYPLNSAVNYIKRCVGLPGETLDLKHGDVYVDGAIATKPRNIQKRLWKNWPVYPRKTANRPVEEFFRQSPEGAFQRRGDDVVADVEGDAWLQYPRPITLRATAGDFPMSPAFRPGEGDAVLSDVLVSSRAVLESEGATFLVDLQCSDHVFRLEVRAGEAPRILHGVSTDPSGRKEPATFEELGRAEKPVVRVGKGHQFEFYHVDGGIYVDVDGKNLLGRPTELGGPRRVRHPIRIGVRDGKAALSDLRVYRDLYNQSAGTCSNVQIPEGHYFALGDNTTQSADSRRWYRTTIEDGDGRTYEYDNDGKTVDRRGRSILFPDVYGEIRRVDSYTIQDRVADPFVPREYIVGKAFFTFYPPFRRGTFNLGLVH